MSFGIFLIPLSGCASGAYACWLQSRRADGPVRHRYRRRRCRRLPFHTNGVGCSFQFLAVCSNQLPISSGLCGCCPSSARRLSTRSIDSAMLSQLPPTGAQSGMTPCSHSHSTRSGAARRWPAGLSTTTAAAAAGCGVGEAIAVSAPHVDAARVTVESSEACGTGSAVRIALRRSATDAGPHWCSGAPAAAAPGLRRDEQGQDLGWRRRGCIRAGRRSRDSRQDTPACGTA